MRNLWGLSLLVCIFCVALVYSVVLTEDDLAFLEEKDWGCFKYQYKKNFSSDEEVIRREYFNKNRQMILDHNKKYYAKTTTYKMAINQFTDLIEEEFKQFMGFVMPPEGRNESFTHYSNRQTTPVPDSKDWRNENITKPVEFQKTCGSSWTFSATETLEAHYKLKYVLPNKFSEQYALDCVISPGYGGCKGARMDQVYDLLIQNKHGLPIRKLYTYTGVQGVCKKPLTMATYGLPTSYVFVPNGDEEELKRVVGTIGPVSFAMNVQEIGFMFYRSGLFDGTACDASKLNHAMVIVGYGTDANGIDYWIIRNSWGEGWGEKGYSRIIRNQGNRCGVASYALYPVIP